MIFVCNNAIGRDVRMSTNLLMPLMMLVGPEGEQGRMNCWKRKTYTAEVQKITNTEPKTCVLRVV